MLANINHQTRGIHPMLFQCWTNVEDIGPTLKQHLVMPRVCWVDGEDQGGRGGAETSKNQSHIVNIYSKVVSSNAELQCTGSKTEKGVVLLLNQNNPNPNCGMATKL